MCTYWVLQKLPQICTVILCICIGKVAWFAVYICGNLWGTQYILTIYRQSYLHTAILIDRELLTDRVTYRRYRQSYLRTSLVAGSCNYRQIYVQKKLIPKRIFQKDLYNNRQNHHKNGDKKYRIRIYLLAGLWSVLFFFCKYSSPTIPVVPDLYNYALCRYSWNRINT